MLDIRGISVPTSMNYFEALRQAFHGDDSIFGSSYADYLFGYTGNDTVSGGGGNDVINGNAGNDSATGGFGNDRVFGASGNDVISGNGGNDVVDGGDGNDRVFGASGDDRIFGGTGNDTLVGGTGYDSFIFNSVIDEASNVDSITDSAVAYDIIELDNSVMPDLGNNAGTLTSSAFWSSSDGVAHDGDDRIIYETDTGYLYYDGNGSLPEGAVRIAELAPNLALSDANFIII